MVYLPLLVKLEDKRTVMQPRSSNEESGSSRLAGPADDSWPEVSGSRCFSNGRLRAALFSDACTVPAVAQSDWLRGHREARPGLR